MAKKIALITGANKGLGKEIARGLGKKSFLVLIGSRDTKNGDAVVKEFAAEGIEAVTVKLDITNDESAKTAFTWIEKQFGKLDVLVNNAGIYTEGLTKPSEVSLTQVKDVYETNVFGVIRMTQVMLPLLRKAEAARIVNMSSGLGSLERTLDQKNEMFQVNPLAYNTSKTAVNAITAVFAKELWDTKIKVNAADPGYCATEINGYAGPRTPEEGSRAAIRLATLAADGPTGAYFDEEGAVPW